MRKLLFAAALVLVAFALSSHAGAVSQCCVSACGTTHAHGSATSTVSCLDAESKALNNAKPGCTVCWQSSVTLTCTKSGSTWTGKADFDYICYTPCGVC